MTTPTSIKNLNLLDLNTMLKHIRMGKDHLQKCLSPEAFKDLLKLSYLNKQQHENIKADPQEHMGNITLVMNAIITGLLGSWLGFTAFVGMGLKSVIALVIIFSITAIICGWVGFISFKLTKKKAQDGIIVKKLRLIELDLLKTIVKRRQHDLNEIAENIVTKLAAINSKLRHHKDEQNKVLYALKHEETSEDIYRFINLDVAAYLNIKHTSRIYKLLKNKTNKLLGEIKSLTDTLVKQEKKLAEEPLPDTKTNFGDFTLTSGLTQANVYIKILTSPGLPIDPPPPSAHRWIKSNIAALITGVAPTLLGSFGSMFVFLSGIPDILKAFNIDVKTQIQQAPLLEALFIGIAFSLTIYYCYSFLHSNYKNFLRSKEIEKTEKSIAEENEAILKVSARYDLLTQISNALDELTFLKVILRSYKKNT